jgi:hypothetical protein
MYKLSGETGRYIFSNVDEIMNVMSGQIISPVSSLVSKYITPCKQHVIRGLNFFGNCQIIMENWFALQGRWIDFELIFSKKILEIIIKKKRKSGSLYIILGLDS